MCAPVCRYWSSLHCCPNIVVYQYLVCTYQYIHKLDLLSHSWLGYPSKTYDIFVIVGCMCQGQTVLTLNDLGVSCLERNKLSPGPRASVWCPGLHNESTEKTPLSLDRNCQNLKCITSNNVQKLLASRNHFNRNDNVCFTLQKDQHAAIRQHLI